MNASIIMIFYSSWIILLSVAYYDFVDMVQCTSYAHECLLLLTRYSHFFQGEGGKLRRAPSWRKKFRTKDRSRESGDEGEPSGTEGQTQQSPQHSRRQGGADNSMHRRTTEHMMNYWRTTECVTNHWQVLSKTVQPIVSVSVYE